MGREVPLLVLVCTPDTRSTLYKPFAASTALPQVRIVRVQGHVRVEVLRLLRSRRVVLVPAVGLAEQVAGQVVCWLERISGAALG